MLHAGWAVALAVALQAAPPDPSTTWTDDRPFIRFFQNLGSDLTALPSLDTARIIGGGAAGTLAIRGTDDNLAAWATREGASSYTSFGVLGDGWVQGGAAVGAYVTGRLTRHPAVTHIGSDLVRAQVLNAVVTRGLKLAVGRARPSGGGDAFPSGHTSASFTSAAVLHAHFGWKVGIPSYAAASLVGWTRVRNRAHWMSDVFFGAAVGTVAGRTVTSGHRARPAWTVMPAATPGGAAVYFVKISGS